MAERHDEADLARLPDLTHRWAAGAADELPALLDVQHDPAERRWYVRLAGDEKDIITVWLTLRERTLHHETYFLAAPAENVAQVYELLLRANEKMYGLAFAIGWEDAIYLRGQVPLDHLDEAELDRIVGSSWQWSERWFQTALRLAFASHFAPKP